MAFSSRAQTASTNDLYKDSQIRMHTQTHTPSENPEASGIDKLKTVSESAEQFVRIIQDEATGNINRLD